MSSQSTSTGRPSVAPSGHPKGIFVKNQWMCSCTPRLPAANFKVSRQGEDHGRRYWICSKRLGNKLPGCGFFLWYTDARARELLALSSAGQTPATTPTPSRALRQRKISESFTRSCKSAADQPSSNKRNRENTKPGSDFARPDGADTNNEPRPQPRHNSWNQPDKYGYKDYEDEDEGAAIPKKVARTPRNTSPNKQQLAQEAMASSTSVIEESPSTRIGKLALSTPSHNTRLQAEQWFSSTAPVKGPNFRSFSGGSPRAAPPSDDENQFSSTAPAQLPASATSIPAFKFTEEVVDVEKEVFNLLRKAGVSLRDHDRKFLKVITARATFKQKAYLTDRDSARGDSDKAAVEIEKLKAELQVESSTTIKLKGAVDDLEHLVQSNKASMKALNGKNEDLRKENVELQNEIIDLDDENVGLQNEIFELRRENGELKFELEEANEKNLRLQDENVQLQISLDECESDESLGDLTGML
ncbi:hypothetical protein DRE_04727 [Drechslerella stenobrocha 248]|uniref:GRF-type domain-containing protein n=1 Tax=Drechslerella stenobrocha 248 TaxID=1043628 RepID=W7HRW8_9PEZI|nr:hypothetical protein DRE_04727 [Drechslerella stenobrocha 248]